MADGPIKGHGSRTWRASKAIILIGLGVILVPTAFLEATSQMRGGVASPIQLPLLTTPVVINVDPRDREQILKGDAPAEKRKALARLGASRLADEPLDATALWLWSLDKSPAKARQALELADKVSRRERSVQLELMRVKAVAGELPESLVHLDHALMVSPKAATPIVRGLAAGLNEPSLAGLLKPYERRPWYSELLQQSVSVAPRAESAAQLLLQGDLAGHELPPSVLPNLLRRLAADGNLAPARQLAVRFARVSTKALDRFGPAASNVIEQAQPLTWTILNDDKVLSELTSKGLSFEIQRGEGGTLLTRVTGYQPGTYLLTQDVNGSDEDTRLTWKMQCQFDPSARDIWSQSIPVEVLSQTYQTQVTIPSSCPLQSWQLVASNFAGSSTSTIDISNLTLIRSRP